MEMTNRVKRDQFLKSEKNDPGFVSQVIYVNLGCYQTYVFGGMTSLFSHNIK